MYCEFCDIRKERSEPKLESDKPDNEEGFESDKPDNEEGFESDKPMKWDEDKREWSSQLERFCKLLGRDQSPRRPTECDLIHMLSHLLVKKIAMLHHLGEIDRLNRAPFLENLCENMRLHLQAIIQLEFPDKER